MQELVWARAGQGGHADLLRLLSSCLQAQRPCLWLVPEPYSHETEVRLARAGGPSACLYAEVVTFALLSERVLGAEGGLARPMLDEGGRLLTLRRALRSVAERLRQFHRAAVRPALLAELLTTLDECKLYRLTPSRLEEAAQAAEGAAAERLSELGYILGAYEAACAKGAMDSRDRYTLTAAKLREGGYGAGITLFVSDFHSFTPQERDILTALADKSIAAHIYLCGEPGQEGFRAVERCAAALKRGLPELCERLVRNRRPGIAAPLAFLEEHWFDPAAPPYSEPHDACEILRAGSAAEECRAAAERVVSLTVGGLRYRDIHILYSDEAYAPLLATIFPHYGVPLFMDNMDAAASKPLFRTVRAVLDCVLYGFRPADTLALLRAGLCPFDSDETDRFEDYLTLWGFRGKRFTENDFRKSPRGYGHAANAEDEPVLEALNRPRRLIVHALRHLSLKKRSAAAHAAALYDALTDLGVYDGLCRRRAVLERAGAAKLALENEQLWELLLHSLEQCAGVLGDETMDLDDFGETLFLTLSGYTVGSIPAVLDAVRAGSLGRFARIPAPAVILLGATDEAMPARGGTGGFFGAEERAALERLHLELPPDERRRLEREELNLYTAFTLATQTLIVSYPSERSVPLSEDDAAVCVKRTAELLNVPLRGAAPPAYPTEREPEPYTPPPPLSPAAASVLFGQTLELTPSRIRLYRQCPFAYFLRYGLRLRERPQGGLDARLVGSILHEILEQSSAQIQRQGGFAAVSAEECAAITLLTAEDLLERDLHSGQSAAARIAAQGRRVLAASERLALCLWEELNSSRFAPHAFELRCESAVKQIGSVPPGAPERYLLKGTADRVDVCEQNGELWMRVADYKSGDTGFGFSELYHGTGAQLSQYLFMLTENAARYVPAAGKTPVAAGFLYLPTKTERVTAQSRPGAAEHAALMRAREKRDGLLLGEPDVLRAMDERYDTRETPLLPVKLTAGGTPDRFSKVADRRQMALLGQFTESLTRETAKGIACGHFPPDPLYKSADDNACRFCGARAVCGFSEEDGELRRQTVMNRDDFFASLAEAYGEGI